MPARTPPRTARSETPSRPTKKSAEELRDALRKAGLRATLPRLAVLALLRETEGPVSHAEMAERLDIGGIDRVTVYRNLLDLARVGLARRTDLGDHVWRFEPAGEKSKKEHPHFLCSGCGDLACLSDLSLDLGRSRKAPRSLVARNVEILVKGLCDRCSKPEAGA